MLGWSHWSGLFSNPPHAVVARSLPCSLRSAPADSAQRTRNPSSGNSAADLVLKLRPPIVASIRSFVPSSNTSSFASASVG